MVKKKITKEIKKKVVWYKVTLGQIIGVFWLTLVSILFVNVISFGIRNNSFLTTIPLKSAHGDFVQAEVSETTVSTIQPIFTLTNRNLKIVTSQPILSDGTNKYLLVENIQTLNQYIYSISKDGNLNWKSLSIDPVSSNIIISSLGGVMFRSGENLKYVNNAGSIIIAPGCFDKTTAKSMIALDSTDRLIIQNLGASSKEIVVCKDGTEIWSIARPDQVTTQPLVLGAQTSTPNTQTSAFTEWKYRNKLTINNLGNPNTLTDYQISLIINTQELISAGKMQSNCADIRFSDSDGQTPLNYWVEGPCNSIATKIWVKVPIILPVTTTEIYIYFGNPGAVNLSNTQKVFINDIGNDSDKVLRAYYSFDSLIDNNVPDSSGFGNNGYSRLGASPVTGKYGTGMNFIDGSAVYMPSLGVWSSFTLEAWVRPQRTISITCGYCSGGLNPLFYADHGGDDCYVVTKAGAGVTVGTNGILVNEHSGCYLPNRASYATNFNDWGHVVVVYSNNTPSIYYNGVIVSRGWGSTIIAVPPTMLGNPWGYLGFFNGDVDEVRTYRGVLTDGEIANLYQNYGFATSQYKGHVLVRKITNPEPIVINNVEDSTINMSEGNVFFNSSVLGASAYNLDSIQPNVQTVTPIWSNAVKGLNTVTISGNNIYSTDLSNVLYSTNKNTGTTNWSLPIGTSQPLVVVKGDVIYALHSKDQYDGNAIYALDVQTGRLIWSYKLADTIDPQSLILDEKGNLNFSEGKNYLIISPQGFKLEEYTLADLAKLLTIDDEINLIDQKSVYVLKSVTNTVTASRDNSTIMFRVESSIVKREPNAHYNNQIQIILDNGHIIPLTCTGDTNGKSVWQGKYILSTNNKDQTEFTGTIETIIANYAGQEETHFSHLPEGFTNQGVVQDIGLTFSF